MAILVAASTLILAMSLATSAGHGTQEGESIDCLDWNLLFAANGVHSPLAALVDAHAGTYTATASEGEFHVDWHTADGTYLASATEPSGAAPAGTAYGSVCVALVAGFPAVPAPGATFTFTQ